MADWLTVGHFWSLAIEEQFYLVWPFVVFALNRKWLMRVCVLCLGIALACRVWFLEGGNGSAAYGFTLCRMDGLAIGAFLALLARGEQGMQPFLPLVRGLAVLLGGLFLAMLAAMVWDRDFVYGRYLPYGGFALLNLFFGTVLVLSIYARQGTPTNRFWSSAFLRFFGKYSYGLYVFHVLFLPLYQEWFPWLQQGEELYQWRFVKSLAFILIGSGISVILALLSWHLYEKHFLALKRFFEYQRGKA